ncbi:MAG: hypothetical protein M0Q95_04160 [Porticoccaceae bacterium]|jgi:tetratricopeptide (TPR) repeat protein|nr:hypothetical protein [Porticoccaceae bacterium]
MNRLTATGQYGGRLALAALLLIALAACAPMAPVPTETLPPPPAPAPAPKDDTSDDSIRSDAEPVSKPTNPAVMSLVNQGWTYYRQNNYEAALGAAGRAQRIDPRSPEVYLLMASARFSLYQLAVAEQLARKGLALAQSGSAVNRQLQALLAKIAASQ